MVLCAQDIRITTDMRLYIYKEDIGVVLNRCTVRWMVANIDGWIAGYMDRYMDGCIDECMEGYMDG